MLALFLTFFSTKSAMHRPFQQFCWLFFYNIVNFLAVKFYIFVSFLKISPIFYCSVSNTGIIEKILDKWHVSQHKSCSSCTIFLWVLYDNKIKKNLFLYFIICLFLPVHKIFILFVVIMHLIKIN